MWLYLLIRSVQIWSIYLKHISASFYGNLNQTCQQGMGMYSHGHSTPLQTNFRGKLVMHCPAVNFWNWYGSPTTRHLGQGLDRSNYPSCKFMYFYACQCKQNHLFCHEWIHLTSLGHYEQCWTTKYFISSHLSHKSISFNIIALWFNLKY